jgi:hypothetical protein
MLRRWPPACGYGRMADSHREIRMVPEPNDDVPTYYIDGFEIIEMDDETVLLELVNPKDAQQRPCAAAPVRMPRKAFDEMMAVAELQTPPQNGLKGQLQ